MTNQEAQSAQNADMRAFDKRYHVPRSQVWPGSRGAQYGNTHLHVADAAGFHSGRIHRKRGDALCGRRGWYERLPEGEREFADICSRCLNIALR